MKGRLTILGVNSTNLVTLSNKKGFEYLKRVIAQKENGSLMYDPMNQKASAALFSAKTVEGLRLMKDDEGASMVQIISEGIIGAMDTGGVSADTRVHALIKLKEVIEVKSSSVLERLRRPAKEDITMNSPKSKCQSITIVGLTRDKNPEEVKKLIRQNELIDKFCMSNNLDDHFKVDSVKPLRNNPAKFQVFATVSPILREGISKSKDKLVMGVSYCKIYDKKQSNSLIKIVIKPQKQLL